MHSSLPQAFWSWFTSCRIVFRQIETTHKTFNPFLDGRLLFRCVAPGFVVLCPGFVPAGGVTHLRRYSFLGILAAPSLNTAAQPSGPVRGPPPASLASCPSSPPSLERVRITSVAPSDQPVLHALNGAPLHAPLPLSHAIGSHRTGPPRCDHRRVVVSPWLAPILDPNYPPPYEHIFF